MAIFKSFKKARNPKTGKLEFVLDDLGNRIPHDRYRFTYVDSQGVRRTGTGTTSKRETKELAAHRQAFEIQIRDSVRPKPKAWDKPRDFNATIEEYMAWGRSCGGVGGRPWVPDHASRRLRHLEWWRNRLTLRLVSDLIGIQPRVEEALRELKKKRTNMTCLRYIDGIRSFVSWAEKRGYLEHDPLKALVPFPRIAKSTRRAMTAEEIARLLAACPPERRLLYEVAFTSGLRAGELRALTVGHLNASQGGLRLDADWTKNRKAGFQPLPQAVVDHLVAVSAGKPKNAPLLAVPPKGHTARAFDEDCQRAVPPVLKNAPGGKIDFHAARVAYTTFIIESGANLKEAQTLARHATPDLTLNVYGRARQDRLAVVAEQVGKAMLPGDSSQYEAERKAVGAETSYGNGGYAKLAGVHGNRTHPTSLRASHRL